jgi:enoyl-[acyl-carrier protein] reductase II
MIKTPVCALLDIEYPIFQGGMAWIADGHLAAAVSNGGGLGIISAMNAGPDYLREQIRAARSETTRPFGVNIMLMSPFADEVSRVCTEEKVAVVTTGAGNPTKFMPMWKDAGIKVIPVVASVAMAKLVARAGASAVIAEGGESGGHVGETTTLVLVPQVCDAVTVPVIAAGGIGDGRGVAACFMAAVEREALGAGAVRKAAGEGDVENGCFLAGQVAGMVTKKQPAAEIIREIFEEAEKVLGGASKWVS